MNASIWQKYFYIWLYKGKSDMFNKLTPKNKMHLQRLKNASGNQS